MQLDTLNKDGISQSMRAGLSDKGRVSNSRRARVYGNITLGYAETLEDVLVGTMLRGNSLGKDVLNAKELIASFRRSEVVDWVSILAKSEDAEVIITNTRSMFDEITMGSWLAGADNERAKRLLETGHVRLKQLEALMSSQEGVTFGSKEAPRN